ncbi:hypothetical protein ACWEIK_17825 [Streptomyces sp. NPDC004673]
MSQPLKLRFTTVDGSEDHTPDFLVLSPDSAMLIDVRPRHLVKDKDLVKFADDRKRQDASIFIWSHVTRGEHLFAPRPIKAGKTEHVQRA